jgi:hypothetical protein
MNCNRIDGLVYDRVDGFKLKCINQKIFEVKNLFNLGELSICRDCRYFHTLKIGRGYSAFNASKWRIIANTISDFLNKKNISCKKVDSPVGRRFGRLVILAYRNGGGYWCRCDCGSIIHRKMYNLCNKSICGSCLKNRWNGKRFGRATIIGRSSRKEGVRFPWVKCKCDCGKIFEARLKLLIRGNCKSCGCLRKEMFKGGLPSTAWTRSIRRKGNNKCLICGSIKHLRAHHLWSKDTLFGKDRNYSSMGVCLCEDCHKGFHDKYGYGKNTPMQFNEYKARLVNT